MAAGLTPENNLKKLVKTSLPKTLFKINVSKFFVSWSSYAHTLEHKTTIKQQITNLLYRHILNSCYKGLFDPVVKTLVSSTKGPRFDSTWKRKIFSTSRGLPKNINLYKQ